jgi:hypothetical protein
MRPGLDPNDPLILALPPGRSRQLIVDVLTGTTTIFDYPAGGPHGPRGHWHMWYQPEYMRSDPERNRPALRAAVAAWKKIDGIVL